MGAGAVGDAHLSRPSRTDPLGATGRLARL